MAGTAERTMALKLIGDVGRIGKDLGGVAKDLDKVDKRAGRVKGSIRGMGSSLASWGKAFSGALVIGGIEAVGDAVGDAWAGFRSGERAAAQLGVTWQNLGKDAGRLDHWLGKVTDSTLKLGTSDDEAVQVFNDSIKRTGSAGESYKRLSIAQNLAASKGISLSAAMKIVDKAATGSKRTVDEFGLKSKTAAGRVKELGDKVKGAADKAASLDPLGVALNGISESLESIVGGLATGDIETALGGLATLGDTLSTAWDGIAPKVTSALDGVTGGKFSEGVALIRSLGDAILPKVQSALESVAPFVDALGTAFTNLLGFLQPVIDVLVGVSTTTIQGALDIVKGALDTITALLNGDFTGAWTAIQTTFDTVMTTITDGIAGIVPALSGIVEGVATEAGKIGQGIADGIVDLVRGVPDTLVGIIRDAANGIIDVWNQLDFRIPEVTLSTGELRVGQGTIFDTGPNAGYSVKLWDGTGDLIPNIPKLAKGGIVPARPGGTLALLGEGRHAEAVMPLDGRHAAGGTVVNVTVHAGIGTNGAEVGRQIATALRPYLQSGGYVQFKHDLQLR